MPINIPMSSEDKVQLCYSSVQCYGVKNMIVVSIVALHSSIILVYMVAYCRFSPRKVTPKCGIKTYELIFVWN